MTTRGHGIDSGLDITTWDHWWEFNKAPYLRLKDRLFKTVTLTGSDDFFLGGMRQVATKDVLRPTTEQLQGQVLPALKRALDDCQDHDADIISSCLIAMAKIGKDHQEFTLCDVIAERLTAKNQEARETAALALGIAGPTGQTARQVELLVNLALDEKAGRRACDRAEVDDRTRSFATYALGLLSWHTSRLAIKQRALDTFERLLFESRTSSRSLQVAAIQAMSLLNLDWRQDEERALETKATDALMRFYDRRLSPTAQFVASHCPTAIAKLLGRDHPEAERFRAMFCADLLGRGTRKHSSHDIPRSCALALGQLCRPWETDDSPDASYSKALFRTFVDHRDKQTNYFALIALGQIGGERNRIQLTKTFHRAKALERTWCGIALGLLAHDLRLRAGSNDSVPANHEARVRSIGEALYDEFRSSKTPDMVGALAVALGLAGYEDAAPALRAQLDDRIRQQDAAGHLCIGLALMRDYESRVPITNAMLTSGRKPRLLQQAAIALGVLGDRHAAGALHEMLREADSNLAKLAAISSALGHIGDQHSLAPLCGMLADTELAQLSRAFGAVALGGVGDKERLPWNSKISRDTNYRACTETLTNGASGILDIL